ncbi:MAG: hypothetical protein E7184_00160 [Erysipelotrichaceae bacterium]|nr:hypothetical protein [Erysipelotrichaceae bacterium]
MDSRKDIVWEVSFSEIDKFTERDLKSRRHIELSIDKIIQTDEISSFTKERLYSVYKKCRDYYLPNYATFVLLYGTAKYGKDFLDEFSIQDEHFMWRHRKYKLLNTRL